MEIWYSISLGDGITAATPSAEIEEAFQKAFTAAGSPPEMAIFSRLESEGRLHCEMMVYFSPAAENVAKSFDAQPCAKPVGSGLGLLTGDPRAWKALFSEGEW